MSTITVDTIRERYHARPFVPFIICTRDGGEYSVDRAEYLAIWPNGKGLIVATGGDEFEVLDLATVIALRA
ncbi:MAG TPA: hypothetical protein P5572_06550 [Phycisphaerae bacterium]|nr:hypothetical protein [Phycisphaerae bacterium]